MKLRNKHTGLVGELHYEPDKEYHFTVATEDPADMTIHKTLAELNHDWEDYKPTEPLIKDEKIRKAVRAWAEANGYTTVKVGYDMASEPNNGNTQIHFEGWDIVDEDKYGVHTLAELCGEEE